VDRAYRGSDGPSVPAPRDMFVHTLRKADTIAPSYAHTSLGEWEALTISEVDQVFSASNCPRLRGRRSVGPHAICYWCEERAACFAKISTELMGFRF